MRDELQLHKAVVGLQQAMRNAWSNAGNYVASLSTKPSEPEIYENRLLQNLDEIVIQITFLLEALQLTTVLADFRLGLERYSGANRLALNLDEFSNPYLPVLEYLDTYVSQLSCSIGNLPRRPNDHPHGGKSMEKRYQVFLSSTYDDLQEERLGVMKALLELDCIPCGMEYFPAANADQWSYIRDLIAVCDYYVVVIAGRYGSTDSEGISFTEKEYDLAIELGIPTVAFIHSDPGSLPARHVENSQEAQSRLNRFRAKLKTKLCKEWSSNQELAAVVSRSLTHLIKKHPRPGWVRADKESGSDLPVLGLHHISLPVRDLNASICFYREKLQLREASDPEIGVPEKARPDFGFPGVWFELPDGQQLHLIEYRPGIDSRVTLRRKTKGKRINFKDVHFALRVRDYDAMYRILSQGVETIQLGPRQFQCYILDPDHHLIEITGFDGPGPERHGA